MNQNDNIGHDSIISFFSHCVKTGSLSHAYNFLGPAHVGKRMVADRISRMLLGISCETPLIHPDLLVLQREVDEKTGTLKKDISVTQIRDLIHRVSQSAFVKDGYVVAIIDGAEYLNKAGANALLKTLEEPHLKTVIFLITQDETNILPTIRSRVQSLYFSPVSQDIIAKQLSSRGVDSNRAQELAYECHGLPGLAIKWSEDISLYEEYQKEKARCISLFSTPFHEKLKKIEDFFEDRDDHIEARTRIIDALTVWMFAFRDRMVEASRENSSHMYRLPTILDRIRVAQDQLNKNIHPRLVLENIILSIP